MMNGHSREMAMYFRRRFFTLFFLCFSVTTVFADNLCEPSCNFSVSFPDGGSITAVEPLVFTFAVDGVLNLGTTGAVNAAVQPVSLDFSSGGFLTLAKGESITFSSGGLLETGQEGNLNYSDIEIDTTDIVTVNEWFAPYSNVFVYNFALTGPSTIHIYADELIIDGVLSNSREQLQAINNFFCGGGIYIVMNQVVSTARGSLVSDRYCWGFHEWEKINPFFLNVASKAYKKCFLVTIGGDISFLSGLITPEEIIESCDLLILSELEIGDYALLPTQGVIITDKNTRERFKLTQDTLAGFESKVLRTLDSDECVVTDGKCITDDGVEYHVDSEENLVPAVKSGGLDWVTLFLFSVLMNLFRQKRFYHSIVLNAVKQ